MVPQVAEELVAVIEDAGTRVDVLLETKAGAIALAEYVRSGPNLVLRIVNGPRLKPQKDEAGRSAKHHKQPGRPMPDL
jgi:hypothetical protein